MDKMPSSHRNVERITSSREQRNYESSDFLRQQAYDAINNAHAAVKDMGITQKPTRVDKAKKLWQEKVNQWLEPDDDSAPTMNKLSLRELLDQTHQATRHEYRKKHLAQESTKQDKYKILDAMMEQISSPKNKGEGSSRSNWGWAEGGATNWAGGGAASWTENTSRYTYPERSNRVEGTIDVSQVFENIEGRPLGDIVSRIPRQATVSETSTTTSDVYLQQSGSGYRFDWRDSGDNLWTVRAHEGNRSRHYWEVRICQNNEWYMGSDSKFYHRNEANQGGIPGQVTHMQIPVPDQQYTSELSRVAGLRGNVGKIASRQGSW